MEYMKDYIRMHVKYWWLYILTIPMIFLFSGIGTVLILYVAFTDGNVEIAENIESIVVGIMSSLPLIAPNYKVSINVSKGTNKMWYMYFILNQSISAMAYVIIYKTYFMLAYK